MSTVIDDLLVSLGFDADTSGADRFDSSLNNVLSTVGKFGAIFGAATAVVGGFLAKTLTDTASQFEKFETQLTTIEGSSEKARKSLDWISEFGAKTPYDVAEVTDAFVKLKAYGLDPIEGNLLESIGNMASGMGKSLDQAVEAIADAMTGENERLKEFGIKGSKDKSTGEITYKYTSNGEQLSKTVANDAEEITKALQSIMDERFTGGMEAMSKTWAGTLSNMGDTWTMLQLKIMNGGLFDRMKEGLNQVNKFINENSDAIDEWANRIGENLVYAWDSVTDVLFDVWDAALWARDAFQSFADATGIAGHEGDILAAIVGLLVANFVGLAAVKAVSTIIAIGRAFALLFSPLALIGVGLIAFFLIAQDIYGYLNGKDSVIGGLIKDYPQIQYVVDGILQLVDAIKRLWTDNQAGFAALFQAIGGLIVAFQPVLNLVIAVLPYAFEAMLAAITMIINTLSMVIQGWVLIFTGVANAITLIWSGLWNGISAVATAVINNVTGAIQGMVNIITNALNMIKKLNNFSPTAIGSSVGGWIKNKVGGGASGGNSSSSSVNQTFNVSSSKDASNIARNSLSNTRARNTGVKQ